MAQLPLITKYRPEDFDAVVGHEGALAALQRVLISDSCPHAFLFTGPSGIGKTTLARIIGKHLQTEITEIDAASNTGIDAIRNVLDFSQHRSFEQSGRRMVIIDECHRLSRNAFDALLKALEDAYEHLYWALCTTERLKVPETIVTRCYETALRPLTGPQIEELLLVIAELEGWTPDSDVLHLAVQAATGQPRKALTILQQIHDAPNRDEARRIINLVEASDPMIEILRHLVSGKNSWTIIRELLSKLDTDNFEEASILATRYLAAVMLGSAKEADARRIWQMMEALVFPAETYDRKMAFIAAVGRILWGG